MLKPQNKSKNHSIKHSSLDLTASALTKCRKYAILKMLTSLAFLNEINDKILKGPKKFCENFTDKNTPSLIWKGAETEQNNKRNLDPQSFFIQEENWYNYSAVNMNCISWQRNDWKGTTRGTEYRARNLTFSPTGITANMCLVGFQNCCEPVNLHVSHCFNFEKKKYYTWFTMFCQFYLYSKETQLYKHIYILFLTLSFIMFLHKRLYIVPCAIYNRISLLIH